MFLSPSRYRWFILVFTFFCYVPLPLQVPLVHPCVYLLLLCSSPPPGTAGSSLCLPSSAMLLSPSRYRWFILVFTFFCYVPVSFQVPLVHPCVYLLLLCSSPPPGTAGSSLCLPSSAMFLSPSRYRWFILVFTFFCYASYHLSRKPISVVKVRTNTDYLSCGEKNFVTSFLIFSCTENFLKLCIENG